MRLSAQQASFVGILPVTMELPRWCFLSLSLVSEEFFTGANDLDELQSSVSLG